MVNGPFKLGKLIGLSKWSSLGEHFSRLNRREVTAQGNRWKVHEPEGLQNRTSCIALESLLEK